jgi:hypothetical protein
MYDFWPLVCFYRKQNSGQRFKCYCFIKFYLRFGRNWYILAISKDSKKYSDVSVRKIQEITTNFKGKERYCIIWGNLL